MLESHSIWGGQSNAAESQVFVLSHTSLIVIRGNVGTPSKVVSKHVHSLGLVHNDLNLQQMMLKADDTPVIIDFLRYIVDSCRRGDHKFGNMGLERREPRICEPAPTIVKGLKKIFGALNPS